MFRITTLLILTAFSLSGLTQSYKFRKYVEQDGLNNRFVYTIDQDEMGNLMIGTGEGLYRYDGFHFEEISEQQGLSDDFLTCSANSSDGGIWYGHNKGLITKYKNGQCEHFDLSAFTNSRINGILEDDQLSLWILTQNDGILKRQANGEWKQFLKGIEDITLYSFFIDQRQRIWLGTDMGLLKAHINHDDEVKYDFIEEIIETKVACITKCTDGIVVGTEDSGIFRINIKDEKYSIEALSYREADFSSYSVNSLFEDAEKNLWICTNNKGLMQLTGLIDGKYLKMIRYQDNALLKTASENVCPTERETFG
ncbi:MAG: hypothetical protein IPP69_18215 [Flavobacteriales bacterium]|nr:hypothetical protein [Flavobacteriales bacterium]